MMKKNISNIEEYEDGIIVILGVPASLLIGLVENGVGGELMLFSALFLLLIMTSVIMWNRKKNKYVLIGGVVFYYSVLIASLIRY